MRSRRLIELVCALDMAAIPDYNCMAAERADYDLRWDAKNPQIEMHFDATNALTDPRSCLHGK